MNWDWYSATVPGAPDEVLGALAVHGEARPCRGLYSYDRGMEFLRPDGEAACRAYWGGVNGEGAVHVQCSGSTTGVLVGQIRSTWPEHRVSRADVAEDWCGPGTWRRLVKIAAGVRKEFGLRSSTVGDWIGGEEGRTLYLGAAKSYVRGRLYEKGKQLASFPDWVRFEIQVRPSGVGKSNLSRVEPVELFGVSPWTREFAARVGVPELDAVKIRDPWRPSDDERALDFMLRQYGALLLRTRDRVGSWSDVGEYLGGRLGERQ